MNAVLAIFVSLFLHGLVVLAAVLLLNCASAPDDPAQLDLSAIEFSLAEEEVENASAAVAERRGGTVAHECVPTGRPETEPAPERKVDLPPPVFRPAEARSLPQPDEPAAKVDAPPSRPDASAAPRQARVDAFPKPQRNIRPDYPRKARLRGEEGTVLLDLDVAADGSVTAVRIVRSSGHGRLDAAAVAAARAAHFTPARSGGKPVSSSVRLPFDFRLGSPEEMRR